MSNGEGARTSTDPVGRPEALAKAEEQLRQDLEVEATVTALLREQFGGFTRVAKEIAAGLAKPVTALLAMGIIACVTDIDKNPPKNPTSASASANPGSSGTAGAGGGPPDPDKWKKKEGALYGMDNFKLVAPATAPAFDQPETKYRDTAQCEVDGIPYTLFTLDDEGLGGAPTLQFASGTAQSPEDAMNSATADFVDGLEEFLKYSLGEIACYKDKIIFDNYGNLKMATLVSENGILKATDIIELPFSSDEITILVDAGVPYLYYGSGTVARVSLSEMLSNPDWEPEPVSELDGLGGSLPAMIIPPDPETGEGLYFGNKGSVVYASKTLAGLAASTALVYELNGSPAAFYTGNVTATPVYNAEGKLVKVFVTFVRQKTKFSKRKLMYVVYEIEDVVVPPPEPPPEPAPETNEPDTVGGDGDTVTPTEDIPTDGDIPW
ncbi:hypothetical protein HY604_01190, partial [Candidatus Peregrinibacteria bacterium]|nr:hypothetical protein [Candidatus Peregrinibacteria bacterium]